MKRTMITHSSGLKIWICDQWYEHLTLKEASLAWIRKDFPPVSNPIMIIFAVAEQWKEASNYPNRQVIFMLARDGAVVAYDRGVIFYVCPTFQDFWTANLVFEFYNAIFPMPIRRYVRQMYLNVEGYVNFYNRLRMFRIVLDASENRAPIARQFSIRGNRFMKMLVASDIAILHGEIPPLFSDRMALHCNVDNRFFDMYWKAKCGTGAKPFTYNTGLVGTQSVTSPVDTRIKIFEGKSSTAISGMSPLSRPFCSISGKDPSSVIFIPYESGTGCKVGIDGIIRKRTTENEGDLNEKVIRLSDEEANFVMDMEDVNLAQHDKKKESAKNFSFVIPNDQGSC